MATSTIQYDDSNDFTEYTGFTVNSSYVGNDLTKVYTNKRMAIVLLNLYFSAAATASTVIFTGLPAPKAKVPAVLVQGSNGAYRLAISTAGKMTSDGNTIPASTGYCNSVIVYPI